MRSSTPSGRRSERQAQTAVIGGAVRVVVAHLRHAPDGADPEAHTGVVAARQIVGLAGDGKPCVLASDLNDQPGGAARAALSNGGFDGLDDPTPTSLFGGGMPGPEWPSDHTVVVARLAVP